MLRLLLVLIVAACGTDTMPDASTDAGPGGGGGGGGGGPAIPPDAPPGGDPICNDAKSRSDLAWIQQHIFTPSCATAMCHSGDSPSVDLSLEAGVAYANLVNHSASTASGWDRVVPGSTSASYLMVALGREDGPMPEDGFMPLGSPALCGDKLDAIARWVAAGAPQ